MDNEKAVISFLDENRIDFINMCNSIFDFSEIRFKEFKSSALQQDYLKAKGFSVKADLAGEKTAFIAEYGSGFPVIGFLGEFDALPELGHGCGHHLLGTGNLAACCALKTWFEECAAAGKKISGTVRYYGCPAEENAGGKAYLVRDGFFDDCDIALSWHPEASNYVAGNGSLANFRVFYNFHGKAAHAAAAPELGRSALDAVELMDVGANYLREHVPDNVRIHYAITNSGGSVPNTVQSESEVLYAIRAKDLTTVKAVYERINDIAKGAALMTGTAGEHRQVAAYANYIGNLPLGTLLKKELDGFVSDAVYEPNKSVAGSTDVGDVSWVCPTGYISTQCYVSGTALHSQSAVDQGKNELAYNGMMTAAKVLAKVAVKIYLNPDVVSQAKDALKEALGDKRYESSLPPDAVPGSW